MLENNLKDLRLKRKLTQKQLAKLSDVKLYYIFRLENNLLFHNLTVLCKLADFFNVSVDYLLARHKNN